MHGCLVTHLRYSRLSDHVILDRQTDAFASTL